MLQLVEKAGVANSLVSKLEHARALRTRTREGYLNAFCNQVNAQTGKALTAEEAALLLRLVNSL